MPVLRFAVDRRDTGKTVAAILKVRLSLTWTQARRLVEGHQVRYAGQVIGDPAHRVKAGKIISIAAGAVERPKVPGKPAAASAPKLKPKVSAKASDPARKPAAPRPQTLLPASVILYADDAIVIAEKPAGVTTMRHAEEAEEFGEGKRFLPTTFIEMLPTVLGTPDRPLIAVHRIDRDTSGVVAFARNRAAATHLMTQFRKHTADRRYLALTRGRPIQARLESAFVRDRGDGRRGSGTGADAKPAVTFAKVLEPLGEFALVECRLETGRTHQVRIHLAEAEAPLCGEAVYDRPLNGAPAADTSGAKRPMLHAARLAIIHPETGERLTWETPPPADFLELLKELQGRASS
ncbi:MAG: RluA family pseudouridine synthase [Gemmataceae bacterium]